MKITIKEQRRAISAALRDARRELAHVKDAEVSSDIAETIRGLEAAYETLKQMETLSVILKELVK